MTRNKWLFRAVWLVAIVPLLVAWGLALMGQQLGFDTKNHGELMPAGIEVPDSLAAEFDGKWGLLMLSKHCETPCQQQLYRMQQLHTAMGKDIQRVQPLWLTDRETGVLPDKIDFRQVRHIHQAEAVAWFDRRQLAWQDHSIWLVDPHGILVMRFAPGLEGKHILADIDWLLKASHIG